MEPHAIWHIQTDGSALPNPGRMGLGAVLQAPDGTRHTLSRMAPGSGCNNEAELRAVVAALGAAAGLGARRLRVQCDSSLVVAQLGSAGAPPVVRLHALVEQARAALAGFDAAELAWVPQHRNAEADALARAALGLPPRPPNPPRPRRKRR